MSVTAPLDIESPHEGSKDSDGIVIHDDISIETTPVAGDVNVVVEQPATALRNDPAMTFVYLGVVTLAIIIAAAAMLAL